MHQYIIRNCKKGQERRLWLLRSVGCGLVWTQEDAVAGYRRPKL